MVAALMTIQRRTRGGNLGALAGCQPRVYCRRPRRRRRRRCRHRQRQPGRRDVSLHQRAVHGGRAVQQRRTVPHAADADSTMHVPYGFAGTQCETCGKSFFGADCDVCPGGGSKIAPNLGNVCSVRGVCDDASHEAGGECTCNEHFNGTDCDSGSRPLGLVEELAETRLRQCATCPAGKAAAAGARECTACAASRFIDRSEDSNWRYGGECVESTDGDAAPCSANCCQASSNVFDARDGGVCRRCVKESDGSSGCLGLGNSASDDAAAWTLATMVLRSGFWRKSATTLHVVECAHPELVHARADRVPNGTYFGDYLCREGHTGPFCAMCLDARGAEAAGYGSTAYTMAADGCRPSATAPNVLTDPKALGLLRRGACATARAHHLEEAARHRVQARGQRAREARARRRTLYHRARAWRRKRPTASRRSSRRRRRRSPRRSSAGCSARAPRSRSASCFTRSRRCSRSCSPRSNYLDLYVWATDALRNPPPFRRPAAVRLPRQV